eukprot:365687-Chlamydomonas_euryale.AAC.6
MASTVDLGEVMFSGCVSATGNAGVRRCAGSRDLLRLPRGHNEPPGQREFHRAGGSPCQFSPWQARASSRSVLTLTLSWPPAIAYRGDCARGGTVER